MMPNKMHPHCPTKLALIVIPAPPKPFFCSDLTHAQPYQGRLLVAKALGSITLSL